MSPLARIADEAGHLLRPLRRARAYTAATVLTVALGGGVAWPMLALCLGGMRWRPPAGEGSFGRLPGGGLGGWTPLARSTAALQLVGIHDILRVLLTAGGLVVAATCVNAGAVALSRAAALRQERYLRAALGATPARLGLAALAEGVLLAGAAAALALGLGSAALQAATRAWQGGLAVFSAPPALAAFALGVGLPALVVVACTTLPTLRIGRGNLHAQLTVGDRATPGPYDGWIRRVLTVAQVACAMGLLVGAGVLLRGTLPAGSGAPRGFDPRDTVTLRLDTPRALADDPAARARYLDAALARVRAVPGVRVAALGSRDAWLNLGPDDDIYTFCRECFTAGLMTPELHGPVRNLAVSPGWFEALRIPLRRGRAPRADDVRPVVVNRALGDRLYPGGDPLGKRLALQHEGPRYTVVGIVEEASPRGPGTPYGGAAAVYLPLADHPPTSVAVLVRTAPGGSARALAAVQRALRGMAPGASLHDPMPLEARLARYASPLRWFALLLTALAGAALLLCSGGVYAVVAFGVERRTREIGVRMALGATERRVIWQVVRGGLRLARTGALLGTLAALATAVTLAVGFRGVPLFDPLCWLGVPLLLAAVTVVASWRPARRAARVDPMVALRGE